MTANDKYPFPDLENLLSPTQLQLSFKLKTFSNFFFCYFLNLHQILNILKKKMIVIATLFRKLQTLKGLVRPVSKKHTFRAPFYSQHVKVSETLLKSA